MVTETAFKPGSANDAAEFSQHMGTDTYYQTMLPGHIMTEGVYDMVQKLACYWLIDIITSYQFNPTVRAQPFQVWRLKRNSTDGCRVWVEDGNDNEIISQEIEYTDFPYEEATIWLTDRTILLPSEY